MKRSWKMVSLVTVLVLVGLLVFSAVAFAQGPVDSGNGPGQNFVDQDGDGLCDLCGQEPGQGPGFVDADGDGVCDNYGTGQQQQRGAGQGQNFVDEDGDGLCDACGNSQQQTGQRRGRQGRGAGRGMNW